MHWIHYRLPLRCLPLPYMKTGETVGTNHAFIRQEQIFTKAQRARMEEDMQRDEVCGAIAPANVR